MMKTGALCAASLSRRSWSTSASLLASAMESWSCAATVCVWLCAGVVFSLCRCLEESGDGRGEKTHRLVVRNRRGHDDDDDLIVICVHPGEVGLAHVAALVDSDRSLVLFVLDDVDGFLGGWPDKGINATVKEILLSCTRTGKAQPDTRGQQT